MNFPPKTFGELILIGAGAPISADDRLEALAASHAVRCSVRSHLAVKVSAERHCHVIVTSLTRVMAWLWWTTSSSLTRRL